MKHRLQRPKTSFGDLVGLFNPVHDRQQTMLAYEANFYPYWLLKDSHQIVWHHILILNKEQILARCKPDDLTEIDWPSEDPRFSNKPFKIHWVYNNIPTQLEWERLPMDTLLIADYRISPIIKDGGGRVCVLSRTNTREGVSDGQS